MVLDRSLPLELVDLELIAANPRALLVANKSDLDLAWHDADSSADARDAVIVSAESRAGLTNLIAAIVARLVGEPPLPGAAVPFRADQGNALIAIRANLIAGDRAAAGAG